MNITINGPTFYHSEDENIFFSIIYGLPEYKEVIGKGRELEISFNKEISDETVMSLLVLCHRWGIDIEPLIKFKNEINSKSKLWENRVEN